MIELPDNTFDTYQDKLGFLKYVKEDNNYTIIIDEDEYNKFKKKTTK